MSFHSSDVHPRLGAAIIIMSALVIGLLLLALGIPHFVAFFLGFVVVGLLAFFLERNQRPFQPIFTLTSMVCASFAGSYTMTQLLPDLNTVAVVVITLIVETGIVVLLYRLISRKRY